MSGLAYARRELLTPLGIDLYTRYQGSGVTLVVKAWSAPSEYLFFNVPANIDPSEWVTRTEH